MEITLLELKRLVILFIFALIDFQKGLKSHKKANYYVICCINTLIKTYDCMQGYYARKVNCSCVYSAYVLKSVLPGRNL